MSGIQLHKTESGSTWLAKDFFQRIEKHEGRNRVFKHFGLGFGFVSVIALVGVALFGSYHGLPAPFMHALHDAYSQPANALHGVGKLSAELVNWSKSGLALALAVTAFLIGAGMGVARQSVASVMAGLSMAIGLYYGPGVMTSMLTNPSTQPVTMHRQLLRGYNPLLLQASSIAASVQTHPLTVSQRNILLADLAQISTEPAALETYKEKPVAISADALQRLVYRLSLPLPTKQRPPLATAYLQRYQHDRTEYEAIWNHIADTAEAGLIISFFGLSAYTVRQRSVKTARKVLQFG